MFARTEKCLETFSSRPSSIWLPWEYLCITGRRRLEQELESSRGNTRKCETSMTDEGSSVVLSALSALCASEVEVERREVSNHCVLCVNSSYIIRRGPICLGRFYLSSKSARIPWRIDDLLQGNKGNRGILGRIPTEQFCLSLASSYFGNTLLNTLNSWPGTVFQRRLLPFHRTRPQPTKKAASCYERVRF